MAKKPRLSAAVRAHLERARDYAGSAQLQVLAAIDRLGPGYACGKLIQTDINARMPPGAKSMSHVQVYLTLKALRARLLIKDVGEKTMPSSPPMKMVALTPAGRKVLATNTARGEAIARAVRAR